MKPITLLNAMLPAAIILPALMSFGGCSRGRDYDARGYRDNDHVIIQDDHRDNRMDRHVDDHQDGRPDDHGDDHH